MCEAQACITVITHFPRFILTFCRPSRLLKGVYGYPFHLSEISLIVKSAFEIQYHLLKHSNVHKHAQTVHRTSLYMYFNPHVAACVHNTCYAGTSKGDPVQL